MKQSIVCLLAVCLLLGMTACGDTEPPASSAPGTTTTESTTTTTATTTEGTPIGISTMKGNTTTTFRGYTTKGTSTTTTTATTTKAPAAQPVMDTPYACWITGGTDLIVARVTLTDLGCVISRTFYTCNPEHKVYGTDVETVTYADKTYYKTTYAPQAAARYEIVGINLQVYNLDGSVAKTFVVSDSNTMECSFSDGIAFGRANVFKLEQE